MKDKACEEALRALAEAGGDPGSLPGEMIAHMDSCESCSRTAAALRALAADPLSAGIPLPSVEAAYAEAERRLARRREAIEVVVFAATAFLVAGAFVLSAFLGFTLVLIGLQVLALPATVIAYFILRRRAQGGSDRESEGRLEWNT